MAHWVKESAFWTTHYWVGLIHILQTI